jgi:assimilatory nitrate reductase catalytic subunit
MGRATTAGPRQCSAGLTLPGDDAMESIPKFLNGVFAFTGAGLRHATLLDGTLSYKVPGDKRAQLVYLRAGNSSDQLICLSLMRDGKVMRMFPVGAKSAEHVALTVVEDLQPDTRLDVHVAAPEGATGDVVLDIGLLEI